MVVAQAAAGFPHQSLRLCRMPGLQAAVGMARGRWCEGLPSRPFLLPATVSRRYHAPRESKLPLLLMVAVARSARAQAIPLAPRAALLADANLRP